MSVAYATGSGTTGGVCFVGAREHPESSSNVNRDALSRPRRVRREGLIESIGAFLGLCGCGRVAGGAGGRLREQGGVGNPSSLNLRCEVQNRLLLPMQRVAG